MSKEYYRPLPKCVTIAPSNIEGLGLHATERIPKGMCLGISHYQLLKLIIRTPLGGFVNHSDLPNVEFRKGFFRWKLYTLKCIEPGEELLATYQLYNPET